MPECSPGTEDRADEVTGTMAMPNPIPAMASVQPTADKPACGEILKSVSKMPTPAITQPMAMGYLAPQAATHRPVSNEAMTMPAVKGRKSRANPYGDCWPTTSR